MGLTPKQQRFVEEYLLDLNAAAAARRAGYSTRTAEWIGPQLLGKSHVMAAVAERQAKRSKRTEIDADWVLKRLAGEAEADLADLYDDAGNLRPMREWPMVFRRGLVVGFETVHETEGSGETARRLLVRKIKLQDRTRTVELIGKHIGVQAFKEIVENRHTFDVAQALARLKA